MDEIKKSTIDWAKTPEVEWCVNRRTRAHWQKDVDMTVSLTKNGDYKRFNFSVKGNIASSIGGERWAVGFSDGDIVLKADESGAKISADKTTKRRRINMLAKWVKRNPDEICGDWVYLGEMGGIHVFGKEVTA